MELRGSTELHFVETVNVDKITEGEAITTRNTMLSPCSTMLKRKEAEKRKLGSTLIY